jgi:hypothetical protein
VQNLSAVGRLAPSATRPSAGSGAELPDARVPRASRAQPQARLSRGLPRRSSGRSGQARLADPAGRSRLRAAHRRRQRRQPALGTRRQPPTRARGAGGSRRRTGTHRSPARDRELGARRGRHRARRAHFRVGDQGHARSRAGVDAACGRHRPRWARAGVRCPRDAPGGRRLRDRSHGLGALASTGADAAGGGHAIHGQVERSLRTTAPRGLGGGVVAHAGRRRHPSIPHVRRAPTRTARVRCPQRTDRRGGPSVGRSLQPDR